MCQTTLFISSMYILKQKEVYYLLASETYTKETLQAQSHTLTLSLKATFSNPK